MWQILAFCAIAFAAAPLQFSLPLGKGRTFRVNAVPAAAFGSALWVGPAYAPLPAFFAVLGRMTFCSAGSVPLFQMLWSCVRLPIIASASAWTYMLLGGPDKIGAFPDTRCLLPVAGAMGAFVLVDQATSMLLKAFGKGRADVVTGDLGLMESAAAALLGAGLAAYRGLLPAAALIPLPLAALVAYAVSLSVADRRARTEAENAASVEAEIHSFIDPLTGLANERYLMMFLNQELSRATRNNYPVSAIMLDLDNFEGLNKEFGREACDRMLSEIASQIRSAVRDYDLVAHYGSDEFLVILPEAADEDSFDTAERIRVAVSSYSPDWLGAEMQISVSGGLASFPDHGVTPDDLINSAHHALNRAKFSGKNRIFSCRDLAKKAA